MQLNRMRCLGARRSWWRDVLFTVVVLVASLTITARARADEPAAPTEQDQPPAATDANAAEAPPIAADAGPDSPPPAEPAPPPAPSKPVAPVESAAAETSSNIDVRGTSEVAAYGDSDHVFVLSPSVGANATNPVAGWSFGGRYLVDVVSAASVDIVSTASRRWTEVRQVGSVDGSYKPGDLGIAGGANVSIEPDYQSYNAGATFSRDLFDKNLTVLLGYSFGHDISGRSGTPFSVFSHTIDIHGFKAGGSLLLDRASILSVVGDVIHEAGDTSKPYRYVPMFAPGTSVPLGASTDYVNDHRLSARVLEQLPVQRDRFALTGRFAHRYAASTLRLDERVYIDSWGLKASTSDFRFLFDTSSRFSLGPHLRFHAQSPVVFWQRGYVMGVNSDVPALRTGDRELGPLLNFTLGGSTRWNVGPSGDPRRTILGLDLGVTSTQYLDDLYIRQRLSALATFVLETGL